MPVVMGAGMLLLLCFFWLKDGEEVIWGGLFMGLWMALAVTSFSRLRGARVDDRFLYLSRGRHEEIVPLRDVIEVTVPNRRGRSVSLRYTDASGKSRWIWFRLPYDQEYARATLGVRFRPHPVVEELRRRIAASTA